jgi:hypothetical protein
MPHTMSAGFFSERAVETARSIHEEYKPCCSCPLILLTITRALVSWGDGRRVIVILCKRSSTRTIGGDRVDFASRLIVSRSTLHCCLLLLLLILWCTIHGHICSTLITHTTSATLTHQRTNERQIKPRKIRTTLKQPTPNKVYYSYSCQSQ